MSIDKVKLLTNKGKNVIVNLIKSADISNLIAYGDQRLIKLFIENKITIQVLEISWLTPFQADFFPTPDNENNLVFAMMVKIKIIDLPDLNLQTREIGGNKINIKKGQSIYGIFYGSVEFESIEELKITNDKSINIEGIVFSKEKGKILNEWNYIFRKIVVSKMFFSKEEKKEFLHQKIDALNELEELDMIDDELFMERMEYLSELAYNKNKRVWGEYNQVGRITSQPVLMNKATAIQLTKIQVVGLVKQLSKLYAKQLEAIPRIRPNLSKNNGVIPIIFTTTMRGHADPNMVNIQLSKLGDWRMGYNGTYSAELVFHEFAHVIDFGRKSAEMYSPKGAITARNDAHRQDFVQILDNMLLKFKDWINSKYDYEKHQYQILNNSKNITEFNDKKEEIISEITNKEKNERLNEKSKNKELSSYMGIENNKFPLNIVIGEHKKLGTSLINFSLKQSLNSNSLSIKDKTDIAKLLVIFQKEKDIILNKEQIDKLSKSIKDVSRNKFISTLPIKEQLKAMPIIKKIQSEIIDLSIGKINKNSITKPNIQIEHYN